MLHPGSFGEEGCWLWVLRVSSFEGDLAKDSTWGDACLILWVVGAGGITLDRSLKPTGERGELLLLYNCKALK